MAVKNSISSLILCFLATATCTTSFCYGIPHLGCIEIERRSLLKFKQDLIDPANSLTSWAGDGDCCRWAGLVCDNITGYICELHLGSPHPAEGYWESQLGGKLNPCLQNLRHLNYLDLSNNNFEGIQLPSFLASMKSLRYLSLSQAGFLGMIPQELGNLSNLHYLDLQDSRLAWKLHAENLQWLSGLSSLEYLDLSNVNLNSTTDWLQISCTLPSLVALVKPPDLSKG